MQKLNGIVLVITLSFSSLFAGDAFNKVMAKNRASKGMSGANYKQVNGKRDFNRSQRHGNTIGLNVENKRIGKVYNYVEIKNVKLKKEKEKRAYGLNKTKPTPKAKNLYGVKINKKFKGSVNNTVKIKNSRIN